MKSLPLRQLYYHRDYDGVVAAAMVHASTATDLVLRPVQYSPNLNWTSQVLAPYTGIVDFLYHPAATFWIDHHATTFSTEVIRQSFRPDAFHVFKPNAASCPGVIIDLPWFDGGKHWDEYVKWANVIDGAAYESPAQATNLANPHLLLSYVIDEINDPDSLAVIVRAVPLKSASEVLELQELQSTRARVLGDEARVRDRLSNLLRLQGQVALLDQSDFSIPYRRYLAYERYPRARYGIGLYRSGDTIIVSVGENPWNRPGPIDLGKLCQQFGGGGRRATAGVPMPSIVAARDLATLLANQLNEALQSEKERALP